MMLGESAFRPYFKPVVAHTSNGFEMVNHSMYSSPEPMMPSSPGKEKARRRRTTFTPEQTAALEREYVTDRYMDSGKRAALAETLQLNEIQVKTWFQNRRAKDKKEGKLGVESPRVPATPRSITVTQEQSPKMESVQEESIQDTTVPAQQNEPAAASPMTSVSPVGKVLLDHPALKAALDSPVMTPRASPPVNADALSPTPPAMTSTWKDERATVAPVAPPPPPASYADYLSLGLNPTFSIPATYNPVYDLYGSTATNTVTTSTGQTAPEYSTLLPASGLFAALSSFDPSALMAHTKTLTNL